MASGDGRRRWLVALVVVPFAALAGWLLLRHGAAGVIGAARVLPGVSLVVRALVGLARLAVYFGLPLLAGYLVWTVLRNPGRKRDDGRGGSE